MCELAFECGWAGRPDPLGMWESLQGDGQTNITWEMSWCAGQSPEPSLILLGAEVARSLGGRLHRAVVSRRSTMGTSVHPPLILQHLQLPSSARPSDQWWARLPGQRRHPAALNTFIFPPGRCRPPDRRRQQRQRWRQNENGQWKDEKTGEEKESGKGRKGCRRRERNVESRREQEKHEGKKEKKKDKAAQSFLSPAVTD